MAQDPGGDFTFSDTPGTGSADLNTLFGVNEGVGGTPVTIRAAGPMTQGLSRDPQGAGGTATTSTVTQTLQGFYGMDPSALSSLQQQLYAGGFYADSYYGKTPKRPQFGVADDDSYAAFKAAVVRAARSQRPLLDIISQASSQSADGTLAPTAQPIQLTNADDLRATFTAVAKRRTGKNPDPALIDRMVDSYHKAEADAQTAAYGVSTSGGTYTQAASPEAYATQQIETQDPVGAKTHDYLDVMDTFMGMLKAAG